MDYICALLIRGGNQPVKLTSEELEAARKRNFFSVLSQEYVELGLLGEAKEIKPFEQPLRDA
jgi:hypothetical protein